MRSCGPSKWIVHRRKPAFTFRSRVNHTRLMSIGPHALDDRRVGAVELPFEIAASRFARIPSKDNLQGELNVKRLAGADTGRSIGVTDGVSDAAKAARTEGGIRTGQVRT